MSHVIEIRPDDDTFVHGSQERTTTGTTGKDHSGPTLSAQRRTAFSFGVNLDLEFVSEEGCELCGVSPETRLIEEVNRCLLYRRFVASVSFLT